MKADEIKEIVKSRYAKAALQNTPCRGTGKSCCGISDAQGHKQKGWAMTR